MFNAYTVLAVVMALLVTGSGVAKVQRAPHVVKVINEVVRVPLRWFPYLAACEFAGGIGLLLGIMWPPLGLAASVGLVLYFVGAMIAHVRVGDFKGLGPAALMLGLSAVCLVLRVRGT
jgi:hypothetical protein